VPNSITVPSASEQIQMPPLSGYEQELFDLLQEDKYEQAKKLLQSHIDRTQSKENLERLQQLAYVDLRLNKVKEAINDLQRLAPPAEASNQSTDRRRAVNFMRIGNMYLDIRKQANAIENYKLALNAAQTLDPSDPVLVGILEPLVGTLVHESAYKEALPYAEHLVSVCELRAKSGELLNVESLFWAYVELARVYKNTNLELREQLMTKVLPLLDKLLVLRRNYDANKPEEAEAKVEQLEKLLLCCFINENKPAHLSDYLFLTSEFRMRTLPLINWQGSDPPRAAILCVHALGLENRAFTFFAKEMETKQFAIYAMDVRGFGAWQSEYGSETVSFDQTLQDVRAILAIIKRRHPGLPVFLLGESMGGGIVLRAASEYGGDMSGVISSVPSAERYGNRKMSAQVALHFLRHPNKAFDIGKQVEVQATSKQSLRDLWRKDPKAKQDLSAIELIKFDKFMKDTEKRCAAIHDTPVLIVQGMADQLVKPKGTYEMFDNVNSKDKTMIIIGSAEHLIFETPKQSKVLLDGLASWLNDHPATSQK
jgi:alpha-beta hydrolase superfamily lysophospholipase